MAKSFRLYTLHAQIRDINPPIWRRIQIEGSASLRRVHHTLQAAFGWTDSHLHEFEIDDKIYAMFDLDDVLESMDPDNTFDDRKAKLEKAAYPGIKFVYKYDFGDGWEHDIVVEKVQFIEGSPGAARTSSTGHALARQKTLAVRSAISSFSIPYAKIQTAKKPTITGSGRATTSTPSYSIVVQRTRRCCAWPGIAGAASKSRQHGIGAALTLKARDKAVRQWLAEEVVPAYLQYKANPGTAMTREQIEEKLNHERRKRRGNKTGSTG